MTTTLMATVDTTGHRVMLTITVTAGATAEVQRSLDNGQTWQVVRGNKADDWTLVLLYNGQADVPDAEAPFDVAALYRARANDATAQPAAVLDPWVSVGPVTLPAPPGGDWVVSPLAYPGFQMVLWTRAQESYVRADPVGVFYALGRSDPIITASVRRAPTGTLALYGDSGATRLDLEDMLDNYATFVVRSPAAHGWGVRYCVFGDATFKRIVNVGVEAWDMELPWWAIESPATPVVSYTVTYYDVRTAFASYLVVKQSFGSYAALREMVL